MNGCWEKCVTDGQTDGQALFYRTPFGKVGCWIKAKVTYAKKLFQKSKIGFNAPGLFLFSWCKYWAYLISLLSMGSGSW